jgi:AcrR family transcriptional regulator
LSTPSPIAQRLIEAALNAADVRGWRRLTLAEIARDAGVGLDEAYDVYPTRLALLSDIIAWHDRAVLRPGPVDAGDNPRDRLFEVVMRRFDSLQSHRAGMRAIVRDVVRDPLALATIGPKLLLSLSWMLEAARMPANDAFAPVRAAGLGLVYLSALRVWGADDSPDLARTMAALDRGLRRAETVAGRCPALAGAEGGAHSG